MKTTNAPFPGTSDYTDANAASATPKFQTFTLPAQQAAFVEFCQNHHDAFARKGWRKWRNPTRLQAKMTFTLSPPGGWHRTTTEEEWPMRERKVTVVIEPGAECDLPELWSSAIVTIRGGEIRGGMCPWLRPVGVKPLPLPDGMDSPKPYSGPEAA